jgi:hypothetical protein
MRVSPRRTEVTATKCPPRWAPARNPPKNPQQEDPPFPVGQRSAQQCEDPMVLNRGCWLVDRDERVSGWSELLPASSPPHRAQRRGRSKRGEQRDRQATSTAAHRDVGAPPRAGAVVGHRPPEAETAVGTTGLSAAAEPRHAPELPRHALPEHTAAAGSANPSFRKAAARFAGVIPTRPPRVRSAPFVPAEQGDSSAASHGGWPHRAIVVDQDPVWAGGGTANATCASR